MCGRVVKGIKVITLAIGVLFSQRLELCAGSGRAFFLVFLPSIPVAVVLVLVIVVIMRVRIHAVENDTENLEALGLEVLSADLLRMSRAKAGAKIRHDPGSIRAE